MSQELQLSGGVLQPTGMVKAIFPDLERQQFQPIKYNRKAALGLGIFQMILGVICITANSLLLVTSKILCPSVMIYGFWGGILFTVAGLFEVLSARKTNMCLIIGSMVTSIVAACLSAIVFGLGIVEVVMQRFPFQGYVVSHDSVAYAIIMTTSALAESIISIIGSALSCDTVYRNYSSIIPINDHAVGNQLVMGYQPTNSHYQALVKPQQLIFSLSRDFIQRLKLRTILDNSKK